MTKKQELIKHILKFDETQSEEELNKLGEDDLVILKIKTELKKEREGHLRIANFNRGYTGQAKRKTTGWQKKKKK